MKEELNRSSCGKHFHSFGVSMAKTAYSQYFRKMFRLRDDIKVYFKLQKDNGVHLLPDILGRYYKNTHPPTHFKIHSSKH